MALKASKIYVCKLSSVPREQWLAPEEMNEIILFKPSEMNCSLKILISHH